MKRTTSVCPGFPAGRVPCAPASRIVMAEPVVGRAPLGVLAG